MNCITIHSDINNIYLKLHKDTVIKDPLNILSKWFNTTTFFYAYVNNELVVKNTYIVELFYFEHLFRLDKDHLTYYDGTSYLLSSLINQEINLFKLFSFERNGLIPFNYIRNFSFFNTFEAKSFLIPIVLDKDLLVCLKPLDFFKNLKTSLFYLKYRKIILQLNLQISFDKDYKIRTIVSASDGRSYNYLDIYNLFPDYSYQLYYFKSDFSNPSYSQFLRYLKLNINTDKYIFYSICKGIEFYYDRRTRFN